MSHRLYVVSRVFEALLPLMLATWVGKKAAGRLVLAALDRGHTGFVIAGGVGLALLCALAARNGGFQNQRAGPVRSGAGTAVGGGRGCGRPVAVERRLRVPRDPPPLLDIDEPQEYHPADEEHEQ